MSSALKDETQGLPKSKSSLYLRQNRVVLIQLIQWREK